jgi:hypothetical protein
MVGPEAERRQGMSGYKFGLSPEVQTEALRMYRDEGRHVAKIARKCGVSPYKMRIILGIAKTERANTRHGIYSVRVNRRGRKLVDFTPEQVREMAAMRDNGVALKTISAHVGHSFHVVKRILKWHSNPPAPKMCASENCSRKGKVLAVSDFYYQSSNRDGLDRYCIECRRKLKLLGIPVKKGRDLPPYDFECPTCGRGIDDDGHKFTSQAQADQCCLVTCPKCGRILPIDNFNVVGKNCYKRSNVRCCFCDTEDHRRKMKMGRPRKYDVGQYQTSGILKRILSRG